MSSSFVVAIQELWHFSKIDPKLAKRIYIGLFAVVFAFQFLFPRTATEAFAQEIMDRVNSFNQFVSGETEDTLYYPNTFPKSAEAPRWTIKVPMTAYNALPAQTDSTPCITASGYNLCQDEEVSVLAANFLPLGTKVKIPELFGDRVFTVEDRMNKRYYYKADVYMKEYSDAMHFGLKYATLEIY